MQIINSKRYKMISVPSKKVAKDIELEKHIQNKTPYKSKKLITESLLVDSDSDSESIEEIQSTKKLLDSTKTEKLIDTVYKRLKDPSLTYLNGEEVKEKLKLYTRIMSKDLINLPLGCRIKYIEVVDTDTFKYKSGGVVVVNEAPKYFVLASNKKTWSVQLLKTIVFREKFEMVREEYETTIKNLKTELKKAHNSIVRFNTAKHKVKKEKKNTT